MYILIGGSVFLLVFIIVVGISISAPGFKGKSKGNFNGKTFSNYDGIKAKGLLEVLKWMARRDQGEWTNVEDAKTTKPNASEEELTIYFINHSTFLIQWRNVNIITDPIFSERTSPFFFAGPQRMRPPGVAFEDVPKIDVILLSHNHYDHLDLPSLLKFEKRDSPQLFVPLGVDMYLKKKGFEKVAALDWWETAGYPNLQINFVPAQHFSGRGMLDRDKTLWGGFIISNGDKNVYFVGDTGYNKRMFDDIKKEHPSIDIALVPIGAYKPKWFMSPIHISPKEAVAIHKQLNIKKSVGMHYGTFPLADDGQIDPENDLTIALQKEGIAPDEFILLNEGDKI